MPIAIGADHLDIAIPSQWRDQEWQHLIDLAMYLPMFTVFDQIQ